MTARRAALAVEIRSCLDAARATCETPGVAATVYVDGDRAFHGASGFRDLDGRTPLLADERFPAYSITKTLTAVVALRLAELGILGLDAGLAEFLDGSCEIDWSHRTSLRQLLSHTAGVPNYSVVESQVRALADSPGQAWGFDTFVRETCQRGLDFEPGQGWSYSNTGYMLLKRALETVSGQSFAQLISEHVTQPAGLRHTTTLETRDDLVPLTPGYSHTFACDGRPGDVRGRYDPGWCATGVVASTADELCRFFEALFGGELLEANSLTQMLDATPVPGLDLPGTPSYGLGIMVYSDSPIGAWFGHGGGGPGYDLRSLHWPKLAGHGVTATVLCNTEAGNAAERISEALCATIGEGLA